MEFKKTSNKITADEFINQAESVEKSEKVSILLLKIPQSIKNKIDKKIKGTFSMISFASLVLTNDMEFFDDKDLLTIFQKAKMQNANMSDFVRYKLGLIDFLNTQEPEKEFSKNQVKLKQQIKQKVEQKAKELELSLTQYSLMKIVAFIELENVFNFDEFQKVKKEATKYEMSVKNYISQKVTL